MIIKSLKPLNIPVRFQRYSGEKDTYITFHEYFVGGEDYEDDMEVLTAHYVQVDIWSKKDYKDTVKKVKEKLTEVGFKRLNEVDLYEKNTKIYHKGIKFYYLEDKDGE